ncbi:MAG: recombinase family protein, partial [Anaerolineae bacterium]|nr:recombinase family protein [Anaerolineae bacterium]
QKGLRVAWDMVYADDHTGFEFRDRPSLSLLRREYTSASRRASHMVIEHIDRLSRNADWHQGYLLDEMKQNGIDTIFWKAFSGRIERAVMGAVAQDAMEQSIARMVEGKREKAISGRVTSSGKPAYGYKLVDSNGNEGVAARSDSHYLIYEPEARIIRYIFEAFTLQGKSLRELARELLEMCPPPSGSGLWRHGTIRRILKSPVYKGEFIAFRMKASKVSKPSRDGMSATITEKRVERPSEEWIHVPVPAIVDAELWELANRMLERNKVMSSRNGKRPYLLTGLITCAGCEKTFSGWSKKSSKRGKNHRYYAYRCNSKCLDTYERERINCSQPVISCRILESAVWSAICKLLLEPATLISILEGELLGEQTKQITNQINFIEEQIRGKQQEDEKLYRAYIAGAFDETEYAERRNLIREQSQRLEHELAKLRPQVMSAAEFEARKHYILEFSKRIQNEGVVVNAPYETKKQILKTVVDRIILNAREGWFRIEGIFPGVYALGSTDAGPIGLKSGSIVTLHSAAATRSALPA